MGQLLALCLEEWTRCAWVPGRPESEGTLSHVPGCPRHSPDRSDQAQGGAQDATSLFFPILVTLTAAGLGTTQWLGPAAALEVSIGFKLTCLYHTSGRVLGTV